MSGEYTDIFLLDVYLKVELLGHSLNIWTLKDTAK